MMHRNHGDEYDLPMEPYELFNVRLPQKPLDDDQICTNTITAVFIKELMTESLLQPAYVTEQIFRISYNEERECTYPPIATYIQFLKEREKERKEAEEHNKREMIKR